MTRNSFSVSVVIATRNRSTDIAEALAAIAHSDDGTVEEVILVDDASHIPLTLPAGAGRLPYPVRILHNATQLGAAASRNAAAAAARGAVLAFLDDDARPLHDWFEVLQHTLTTDRAAITGRVLPFDGGTVSRARQYRYEDRYARYEASNPVPFFAGGNSAVWKRAFLDAEGFPDITTASDNGLVARLAEYGGSVHFVPELRVVHRNGKGVRTAAREAWRAGRSTSGISPAAALRTIASVARNQPWHSDFPVAALNTGLQALHSLGTTLPERQS
ncbi:glycosyltransferase [Nocardia sp. NPDC004722]